MCRLPELNVKVREPDSDFYKCVVIYICLYGQCGDYV